MSETQFSSFTNYKQTVIDLTGDLKKILEFSRRMNLDGNVAAVEDVLKRLAEDTFSVAIVGEFKRGKSTLINALLEKDVLPTDVVPTTATINRVGCLKPLVSSQFFRYFIGNFHIFILGVPRVKVLQIDGSHLMYLRSDFCEWAI